MNKFEKTLGVFVIIVINKIMFTAWRSVSPTWESPSDLGFDFEYTDEQQDDDDTSADDSVSVRRLNGSIMTINTQGSAFI